LYEFAVGGGAIGGIPKDILCEGKAMLDTLLNQFLEFEEVITLIDKRFCEDYKRKENLHVEIIKEGDDLTEKVENILKLSDMALIIAPEDDGILHNLTKIVEDSGILNLGSSSEAIKIAGDKYLTYESIKDVVKTPKTVPLKKYIVKKRDGCGGEHVIYDENYLIQEFVEGESYSVSLIVGKKIHPISLNRQYINTSGYCGGEINISHPLKEEIFKECIKAVKVIDGLRGYVGVDVIVGDEVYIIEINPRITTSIYGLKTNPSLAKLLIDNALGKELKFKVEEGRKFIKKDGKMLFIKE
jgi:predicted ATP-grasp superfamily ATP-dependent carboligase